MTETTEKPTFNDRFAEIWQELSHNQRRFVVQMTECSTKKEAAELIGILPRTTYAWPATVDEAIVLLLTNAKNGAVNILTSALARAVMVKLAGLESDDERVRQDAASEVMDRVLGKATQKQEITRKDDVDAAIARELERLAGGREDALSGDVETDANTKELQ